MSTNPHPILPWHQNMAQEHYRICKAHYYAGAVAIMSESIALNYARLEAQHAETLRLLEDAADEIEGGESEAFGLTAYQVNLCKAIRAHLVAQGGVK